MGLSLRIVSHHPNSQPKTKPSHAPFIYLFLFFWWWNTKDIHSMIEIGLQQRESKGKGTIYYNESLSKTCWIWGGVTPFHTSLWTLAWIADNGLLILYSFILVLFFVPFYQYTPPKKSLFIWIECFWWRKNPIQNFSHKLYYTMKISCHVQIGIKKIKLFGES